MKNDYQDIARRDFEREIYKQCDEEDRSDPPKCQNAMTKRNARDADLIRALRYSADERGIIITDMLPRILADLNAVQRLLGRSPHLDALSEVKRDVSHILELVRDMRGLLDHNNVTILNPGTATIATCNGLTGCAGRR